MIGGGPLSAEDRARISRCGLMAARLRVELGHRLLGQDRVIEQVLTAFFAGGHALLMGVPGLGKTMLIRTLAETLSLRASRIQFTPDLMPSDITGTEILVDDPANGTRVMRFQPGPIFAHLVLADEINRTPPKTQAALIEAMEERQVTAGGHRHTLEEPFFVMATQNPIEQEGTYPLPAAQMDRFMLRVELPYPPLATEVRLGRLTALATPPTVEVLLSRDEVLEIHALMRRLPVPDAVARHALALVRATRPAEPEAPGFIRDWIAWGAGPRAVQWLISGAKARAALDGRESPTEEDVRALVHPVMRHRIIQNFRADAEGITADAILDRLLDAIPGSAGPRKVAKKRSGWRGLVAAVTGRR